MEEAVPSSAIAAGAFLVLSVLTAVPDLAFGLLPVSPGYYLSFPTRLYYLFSLDLFALVALPALLPFPSLQRHAWRLTVAAVPLLMAYETYDAAIQAYLHRSPIFTADLPHVWGAVHLLLNTVSPSHLTVGFAGIAGGTVVLATVLPPLARRMHHHAARPAVRLPLAVTTGLVVVAISASSVVGFGGQEYRFTYLSTCLSTTECAVRNAVASVEVAGDVERRLTKPADSTYLAYDRLQWSQPPNTYLVMIESYGSVLHRHPDLRDRYRAMMDETAAHLRDAGWASVTATSQAPVFGGLSWLTIAETFLGTPVHHQPVLQRLRPDLPRYPHLVSFYQSQGYRTAALQPPVRQRAGLKVENSYGFDRTFYFRDLNYRGPLYGFGRVPDQYSLHAAHRDFVEPAVRDSVPFFLFFETTAAHTPWDASPPLLDADPARFNAWTQSHPSAPRTAAPDSVLAGPAADALRDGDQWDLSPTRPSRRVDRYFDLIAYNWSVLERYLRRHAPPNSLVIVAGDHQPRFADRGVRSTPVHVLSRRPELVQAFVNEGFADGLHPPSKAVGPAAASPSPAPPSGASALPREASGRENPSVRDGLALTHAGLYSLLVRAVTAATDSASNAPALWPRGVPHVALRPQARTQSTSAQTSTSHSSHARSSLAH